jgi:hypothetical protein
MPLVLRVDVDKPYGRSNVKEKVLSKICEEHWMPSFSSLGYLNHLKTFLAFLSEVHIKAHIYFRKCTLPPRAWLNDDVIAGHMIGLHAENTRSYETLRKELEYVINYFHPIHLTSFTKHGSGSWKSGRNHYYIYEPEKYLEWAERLKLPFLFGNEEIHKPEDIIEKNNYYPRMLWIDREDSDEVTKCFEWIIRCSITQTVAVIIHPCNFVTMKSVRGNLEKLISLARQHDVIWQTV